ncbi:MAG TPA: ATP-binding cassette domain-containing protein [Ilumatobacteraceae bacterium]|nr:ATP-binding cassette domain-containing protein [Ilumatobacteraceae bacterium]MBP9052399.1 ATP-binding cassette domain-containing protein [Ilumatobacteraceae bacterium]HQY14756.1 ATP-binding cassette domain-containing protein [Ilumatobacteraceae bacterium]HRC48092.1 ATP-binding cassette domain-containing protein [Ilumatobacteraceae bacterium]
MTATDGTDDGDTNGRDTNDRDTNDRGTVVTLDRVTVEYGTGDAAVRPLDGFSTSVPAGRLAILLGPSGCGKTTLLSCLAGLQRPTSGSIRVGDHEVTSLSAQQLTAYRRSMVGVVFQAFNLVPSLTAAENVMMPMLSAGVRRRAARERARELLSNVGLAERVSHRPGMLSGGQMQRVAIARALALDPALVVADEPTANLDHVQVEAVLRIIRSLTSRGRTVIISTHDHRLLPLADQVIDMSPDRSGVTEAVVDTFLAIGDELFAEGEVAHHIYVVESGRLDLTRAGSTIGVVEPGEVFGEMGPTFTLPRSATATALEPSRVTGYSLAEFTRRFGEEELRRLVGRWS